MSAGERDEELRAVAREVLRELVPGMLREVARPGGNGHTGNGPGGNGHTGNGHTGNGHAHAAPAQAVDPGARTVPQVPAPPLPAVMRPSTWDRPPAPGEVIGDRPAAPPSPAPRPKPPATAAPSANSSPPAPRPQREQPAAIAIPGGDARVVPVTLDTDEDLMQFVRQLISRVENPRERVAIRTGRLRFALRRSAVATQDAPATPGPVTRVEKGAVTERVIRAAAEAGTRLVLAPGIVVTPLAREQARSLGVEIERERRC